MGCVLGKRAVSRDLPRPAHSVSGDDRSSIAAADSAAPPPPLFVAPKNPSGWPAWLVAVAGEALQGWTPRRADSFQKLSKIGSGTYSNVYKARDLETGRVVALKKVRFDAVEPESVRFMAREISLLRRLDHPNIVKLEGLVTSRVSPALYLIFEYMEHDLTGLVAAPGVEFSEPQVKCYMKQLLCGLEHCHSKGVLHRDIKGSNLLIDNKGILKIADFGLASTFDPDNRQPMTSRVVTLWYRAPELLLGATYYGVGIDLWSAGCILAELLLEKPILPGRTEVEQLHKIFKLCGSPSEKYWKKNKLPHATIVKPQQNYTRCISEMFKDFPQTSLALIDTLLSIDPEERGTATAALSSSFFSTEPYACDPSSLPHYPPSKEMDAKLRDEKARRQKTADRKGKAEVTRRHGTRRSGAIPAPEANAELKINLDRRRLMTRVNLMSKSEKFPPPHQDGAVGVPLDISNNGPLSFVTDASFASSIFEPKEDSRSAFTRLRGLMDIASKDTAKRITNKENQHIDASHIFVRPLKPTPIGKLTELERNNKIHRRTRGKELEVFGGGK